MCRRRRRSLRHQRRKRRSAPVANCRDRWSCCSRSRCSRSLGALIVLAAVAAGRAWQNRPRLIWRRQRAVEDFDVLEPVDLAAAVAADAAAQRAALAGGTPRNGIVECWLRLEAVIADAGVPRRQSDTSAELTERVLAARAVDPAAIRTLSSLYREARALDPPDGRRAASSRDRRTRRRASRPAAQHPRRPDRRPRRRGRLGRRR